MIVRIPFFEQNAGPLGTRARQAQAYQRTSGSSDAGRLDVLVTHGSTTQTQKPDGSKASLDRMLCSQPLSQASLSGASAVNLCVRM